MTLVTDTDREVEIFIRQKLQKSFPTFGILGEEGSNITLSADFLWGLDPIDGTVMAANDFEVWTISLGLLVNNVPTWGVVYNPTTKTCAYVHPRGPLWKNRPMQIREPDVFTNRDILFITSHARMQLEVSYPGAIRSLGSSVAEIVAVARGVAVAAVCSHSSLWDILGAWAILRSAGGDIWHLEGDKIRAEELTGGETINGVIIATTSKLLPRLRQYLSAHNTQPR